MRTVSLDCRDVLSICAGVYPGRTRLRLWASCTVLLAVKGQNSRRLQETEKGLHCIAAIFHFNLTHSRETSGILSSRYCRDTAGSPVLTNNLHHNLLLCSLGPAAVLSTNSSLLRHPKGLFFGGFNRNKKTGNNRTILCCVFFSDFSLAFLSLLSYSVA